MHNVLRVDLFGGVYIDQLLICVTSPFTDYPEKHWFTLLQLWRYDALFYIITIKPRTIYYDRTNNYSSHGKASFRMRFQDLDVYRCNKCRFFGKDFNPLTNITLPRNRWKPSLLPAVEWNPWNDIRRRDDIKELNISFPYGPMPDDVTKRIIQSYYAAVTYVDDLIGQLLKDVDDNTIVVVTSDHGWSIGEHGEFSKFSNFMEATKVPIILYVPKLSKKKVVVKELVELVDLFPTLVDLTQVSNPLKRCSVTNSNQDKLCTEGRSLVPVMVKSAKNKKVRGKSAVFSQYPRPGPYATIKPDSDRPRLEEIKIMGYSIKTKRHRYCEWIAFNSVSFIANWNETYGVELYDHLVDPEENLNLADRGELKNLMSKLRRKLILGWRYA